MGLLGIVMDIEAVKIYLEKMERIFFKQAVWDLKVIAQLVDKIPADHGRKPYFVNELKNGVLLNPVRLRWVWFHSDIRELLGVINAG